MKFLATVRRVISNSGVGDQAIAFHFQMAVLAVFMTITGLSLSFPVHYVGAITRLLVFPFAIGVVAAVALPFAWVCWEWKREWFPVSLELTTTAVWTAAIWALSWTLAQVAARSPFPLADSTLAGLDAHIFQTVSVVRWIDNYPLLRVAFMFGYAALDPLTVLALVVPILCGRFDVTRNLLLAGTVSLVLTIGLFALVPAIGPWTVEGFHPSAAQASIGPYLKALKSGVTPTGGEISGIVAFPSFHTVLAVLAGATLWKIRKLRWFAVAVSSGVCIGTLTTGWHYVVDVLAGCAVASVSWFAAHILVSVNPTETNRELTSGGLAEMDVECT
jgi:hypothetical protein